MMSSILFTNEFLTMKKIIFSLIITFFISAYGVAEQTTSTFSVNGWTPGNTTPLSLNYGSSLTTILNFTPCWSGGQVDHDNPDDVWLDYYYTLYLTPVGSSFSTTTSIPIGNHHIHIIGITRVLVQSHP